MNTIRILLFLCFGMLLDTWAETPALTPAWQIVVSLAYEHQARHLSIAEIQKYVGNNKDEVIAILRKVESGHSDIKDVMLLDSDARIALLKLNDRITIDKIMSNFVEYRSGKLDDYGQDMATSAQPMLIQYLAAHLFLPASAYDAYERERVKHLGDVLTDSPVFLPDVLIIKIIRDSDQFSEATREWAKAMWRNSTKQEAIRKILQVWWNENKQLLQSGNFGAVKPGTLPPEDQPTPLATPQPKASPKAIMPTTAPTPALAPQVPPAKEDISSPKEASPNRALLLSFAAIILGGLGIIAYRKHKK